MTDAGGSYTEANHIGAFTRGNRTISGGNY
jgi:hypothetical protein